MSHAGLLKFFHGTFISVGPRAIFKHQLKHMTTDKSVAYIIPMYVIWHVRLFGRLLHSSHVVECDHEYAKHCAGFIY